MRKITIPSFKSFQYSQLWRVTEYGRDGSIKATENTGLFYKNDNIPPPKGFVFSNLSTLLLRQDTIDMNVVTPHELSELLKENNA